MTNIVWPVSLPQVLMLDGLNAKRNSAVVRTQMDAGPQKVRRRYTVSTKTFTGSIIVTEAQRVTLESFYRNVLADGALRFVLADPQTLEEAEFRFADDYSEESLDGYWKITMTLEKMNG